MRRLVFIGVVFGWFFGSSLAAAEEAYMYHCKSAKGVSNFSDQPCAKKDKVVTYKKIPQAAVMHSVAVPVQEYNPPARYYRGATDHCQRVNVMAINQKYDTMIFEARYAHQREAEKGRLQYALENIESQRRYELQGCA